MTISEFVECEADTDAAVRFAGSVGEVDLEYTPILSAADTHYATRAEVAALRQNMADMAYRIRVLERLAHKPVAVPWAALADVLRMADRPDWGRSLADSTTIDTVSRRLDANAPEEVQP